jgi:predicted aspartyl protease
LYIPGKIGEKSVNWFVDTGCSITILSHRAWERIPREKRPKLFPFENSLKSADDSDIKSYGETWLDISIGDQEMQHNVVVADVHNEGLIGIDFMKKSKMVIDVFNEKIFCHGAPVPVKCSMVSARACRIRVAGNIAKLAGNRALSEAQVVKLVFTAAQQFSENFEKYLESSVKKLDDEGLKRKPKKVVLTENESPMPRPCGEPRRDLHWSREKPSDGEVVKTPHSDSCPKLSELIFSPRKICVRQCL